MKFLLTCLAASFYMGLAAQDYSKVDNYVQSLGALPNDNVAMIAQKLTVSFPDKQEKARAVFYWIANNIALDAKAIKGNDKRNIDPVKVIELRKATPLGYSLLFQEMCSQAGIRCLSVDGYTKSMAADINEVADEINHSWNVVQLGQSPETWYYVDAAKASGFLDARQTAFIKSFTSNYFFTDRLLFNLDHYADNTSWQLGPGPKSLKDFFALPVIFPAAYEYGLQKPTPYSGQIKTKTKNAASFSFPCNGKEISSVELVMGNEKKQQRPVPMNFSVSGTVISFNYQFKNEEEIPIKIVVNGKDFLAYHVIAEE